MRRVILIHLVILSLTILIGAYLAMVVQQVAAELYRQSGIASLSPRAATLIYDENGEVIARLFLENRELLRSDEIPDLVKTVFISVEDHTFHAHPGFSLRGIARAFVRNLKAGRVVEGGSTITEQLAKNLINQMERTASRKLETFLLAIELERRLTKDEILEKYLNQIYFGGGVYGIKSAARYYFGKEVRDVTLMEAACLAAIPKNPAQYSPYANHQACLERAKVILHRMVVLGTITSETEALALAQPLNFIKGEERAEVTRAPYFIDYIKQDLLNRIGKELLFAGGLRIYTTLNLKMQTIVEKAFLESTGLQGGVVVLDPRTGYIKAMVGGRDFGTTQFNRAVQAQRQPGSAFKPFVYLTALENGFTPATRLDDTEQDYPEAPGWHPHNYSGTATGGQVIMQRALEKSLNLPTINLARTVGIERVINTAIQLGIRSKLEPVLSLALGGCEVNLLELTSAFGVFANQGVRCEPCAIRYVTDGEGRLLTEVKDEDGNVTATLNWETPRRPVMSPQYAYLITNMMTGVMTRGTAAGSSLGRPSAGKTGTTDNEKSVWFLGFTPELACGVYIGRDDNKPLPRVGGRAVTGASIPAPIWKKVMTGVLAGTPVSDFPVPSQIVFRTVCLETGLLASEACPKVRLAFMAGTEPAEICQSCSAFGGELPLEADGGLTLEEIW